MTIEQDQAALDEMRPLIIHLQNEADVMEGKCFAYMERNGITRTEFEISDEEEAMSYRVKRNNAAKALKDVRVIFSNLMFKAARDPRYDPTIPITIEEGVPD